ncbi:MAG: leucine-rich repeat protein [Prevotella sp.]|nr:leucine-rich repeat protein [Prevotella sp.]
MKRTILLSLLLALVMTKANAYDEVAGFDGPTWYEYTKNFPSENDELAFFQVMEKIFEGEGTSETPFLIKTPEQLAWIAYQVNVKGKTFREQHFRLAANITLEKRLNNELVNWVPIGLDDEKHEFWGFLENPNKFVISNMYIKANGTETTKCFGLFGSLCTSVTDILLEEAEIELTGITNRYYAGLLCGILNNMKQKETYVDYKGDTQERELGNAIGVVKNCQAQGFITACGNSAQPWVGGIVGYKEPGWVSLPNPELTSCVARTEITITGSGTIIAGGVVGNLCGLITDCHAVVKLNASGLATDSESYIGGVVGACLAYASIAATMKFCTSSGEMTVKDNSKVYMGGVLGYNTNICKVTVYYNASAATLVGGHTVGGLIGYGNPRNRIGSENKNLTVENCLCNGYINGEKATYAGGLFGYLCFGKDASTNILSTTAYNYFCGTMKKPKNSDYYGVIFGGTENLKDVKLFCKFGYDKCACDFQTNGAGLDLSWQTVSYTTPRPSDGEYSNYRNSVLHPAMASGGEGGNLCFYDNYALCDIPFHVTNDWKTFYRATDVTIDFTIDDFKNKSTGERVAVFTVPDNMTCVKVVEKHIYPLDPGEVDVTVTWNGLQRKVHLDITYGLEWKGNRNEVFEGGDGSKDNPYLIHNADQFFSAVGSTKYNKKDVYIKLVNDIFFNTHLLKDDGTPREDAIKWNLYSYDFNANLDGNGKTIYGLYVNKDKLAEGETIGIFKNLYGTVKNLAIVDSDVSTNDASYAGTSAGLLCGTMKEGASVSNCLFHGRVSADSYCGGIAAYVDANNTSITDCFTSVHLTWPAKGKYPQGAGGVSYDTPATLERCVSTGRVEKFRSDFGSSYNALDRNGCYFDIQMQAGVRNQSQIVQESARTTDELVNGNLMKGYSAWKQDAERYPMLSTFADTPYGKLLAMPIYFDIPEGSTSCYDAERAGDVNYIFEFPTEDVTWSALHGQTYIDVINDCGAASIVKETGNDVEILIAEAQNVESQCTRARRTLPLNLRSGLTHFLFKDEVAQAAAETAFDKNQDEILTLRELVEATKDDFAVFNASAKANVKDLKAFPEFRYFTNTQTVEEGMISDLAQLSELQLPKKLTTIAEKAFSGCASLEEITVPATFTTMNEGALYESSIKDIFVNRKHKTMESIDGALFSTDNIGKKHLVIYPPGRGKADATISILFHFIDDYAFYKVPKLRNIYIDNCLPEGNLVEPEVSEQPIIHENSGEMMDVYVNDGSYQSKLFKDYQNDPYWGTYEDAGHLHIYYPLNVTNAMWATLYIGFPTQLPEGLTAYVATEDVNTAYSQGKDVITLKSIGRVIPATTPVIINAESAGLYPLVLYTGSVPDVEKYKNKFIGTYIGQTEMGKIKWGLDVNQETSASGGTLTLGYNSNGEVGFFKYDGEVIPPYRAYLGYTNLISNARFLFMIEDTFDGIATGVSEAPTDGQTGQAWYTLEGVRLNGKPTQKGIYIVNGKKYYAR